MEEKLVPMAVRLPFCPFSCGFCGEGQLLKSQSTEKEKYVQALEREILASAEDFAAYTIDSISFTGGISTAVDPSSISRLIRLIRKNYRLASNAEVILRAYPGTLSLANLGEYLNARITGIEFECFTAMPAELEALHIPECFLSMRESAAVLLQGGYHGSFAVNCFFGAPGQTPNTFIKTLGEACNLGAAMIGLRPFCPGQADPLYPALAEEYLEKQGFSLYAPLLFAKPGQAWRAKGRLLPSQDHIGFGLGAASSLDGIAYENTRDLARYLCFSHDFTQITQVL